MALGDDVMVWGSYVTEHALAHGDSTSRIRAVRTAYLDHGFDIDLITELSGFPVWRVRQAILGG
ncbi:hypothetical protein LG299_10625 [Microbacterium lacus]|uniref:hypothetical protein n=1 Tax=Microbacterium lacus TaxID=415217 RepID=UPI00385108EC